MLQQETFILGISFLTGTASGKVVHLVGEDFLYFSFCTEQGSFPNWVSFWDFFCYMSLQKMVHLFLAVWKDTKLDILLWPDQSGSVHTAKCTCHISLFLFFWLENESREPSHPVCCGLRMLFSTSKNKSLCFFLSSGVLGCPHRDWAMSLLLSLW